MKKEEREGNSSSDQQKCYAKVIVIGDIGHSPRMCYHAFSLASHGYQVTLIGHLDSTPHQYVKEHENIRIVTIPRLPITFVSANPFLKLIIRSIKLIWLLFAIFYALIWKCTKMEDGSHKMILLQNPPGIPAMTICYLVAKIQKAIFIVDWHNYTFSMLGHNWISSLAAHYEGFFGRRSNLNFCVSNTMKKDLLERWSVSALTLYDRPPKWFFITLKPEDKAEFLYHFTSGQIREALASSNIFPSIRNNNANIVDEDNLFVSSSGFTLELKQDRPFLLVSSTSWTPDEDFSLLLDALTKLDKHIGENDINYSSYPKFLVVITGKGPLKEVYMERIMQICWKNVCITTAWLSAEDYPKLLNCADLGISLHTSTSSFDLPMKVVDMFGSGLPVLAKNFQTIPELVYDGINGILFDTSDELENLLADFSLGFPNNQKLIEMHRYLHESKHESWEQNWDEVFWPILRKSWDG